MNLCTEGLNVKDTSSTEKHSLAKDNPNAITNPNTVVFICNTNGKFLNKQKVFQPEQKYIFISCPRIENASSFLERQLIERPQLIVIHMLEQMTSR